MKKVLLVFLLIGGLVLSTLLGYKFLAFSRVPKTIALEKSAATKLIKNASLKTKYADKYSDRPIGTIVGSKPTAGSSLKKSESVVLLVSKGLPSAPVLTGLDVKKARTLTAQIKGTRFRLKIAKKQYDNNIGDGLILAQSPSANTSVSVASTFELIVSKGQPIVPDLSDASLIEAQERIQADSDAALVFNAREEYSDDIDKDQVISQNPPAGARVAIGTSVEVVISKGELVVAPPPNPYPDAPDVEWNPIRTKYVCTSPEMGPSCPHADLH